MNTKNGFLGLARNSQQIWTGDNQTWENCCRRVHALSMILQEKNIQRVTLFFHESDDFTIALLACIDAGVDIQLPPSLDGHHQQWIQETSDILLCNNPPPSKLTKFFDIRTVTALETEPQALDFFKNIHITFQTSGSSGSTQYIEKTWHAMLKEADALLSVIPLSLYQKEVVVLSSVTPQHLYGFTFRIVLSLLAAWRMTSERKMFPESLLGASSQIHDTHIVWISSPTLLHRLQELHFAKTKIKLDLIISSGAALNGIQKQYLQEKTGAEVLEIYGSTETGVMAKRLREKYWQFLPEVQYQVDTQQGVSITSPWCLRKQWIADSLEILPNGFEILGRLDRILKLADKRISLQQMEQSLLEHIDVQDVYLSIHPNQRYLVALIALSDAGLSLLRDKGRKVLIKQLKAHLACTYGTLAYPKYWRFYMTLPRNSQSKLDKQKVEQMMMERPEKPLIVSSQAMDEDEHIFEYQVPVDLKYFSGHFDAFPIVPGVIQMKWVLEALSSLGWIYQAPMQWENLKFQQLLRPNDTVQLRLKRNTAKKTISFTMTDGDKKVSSGRLLICIEEE